MIKQRDIASDDYFNFLASVNLNKATSSKDCYNERNLPEIKLSESASSEISDKQDFKMDFSLPDENNVLNQKLLFTSVLNNRIVSSLKHVFEVRGDILLHHISNFSHSSSSNFASVVNSVTT